MDKLGFIILAGGLSSRMGRPKALLPWIQGESLISHALRKALDSHMDDIIISVGDDDTLGAAIQSDIVDTLSNDEKYKISIVRDSVPRCGPLGGLYSALSVGLNEAYAVTAVDMPFMDTALYYGWLHAAEESWQAIIPVTDEGRLEPMAGIYKTSVVSRLQPLMTGDDVSLRHAVYSLGAVCTVPCGHHAHELCNVNSNDEYRWARAEAVNENRTVPVLSIVASRRKTGKTTIVTRIVGELSRRNITVGVVKSDKHGFHMDHEGSDTDRAFAAGAAAVAIAGPEETAIRIRTEEQSDLYHLTQRMPVDLVILETRSQGVFPIMEVTQRGHTERLISDDADRLAEIDIAEADRLLPDIIDRIECMIRGIHERSHR